MAEIQQIFTDIYNKGGWIAEESVSGKGSDPKNTVILRKELLNFFDNNYIMRIIDAPCGDCKWHNSELFTKYVYRGVDIVDDLITANKIKFGTSTIKFNQGNITSYKFPKNFDIFICRNCLVHLSTENIILALKNIVKAQPRFIALTNFIFKDRLYKNINDGDWRPLNFYNAPFNFPPAFYEINEQCNEDNGIYTDRHLSIWKLEQIQDIINEL